MILTGNGFCSWRKRKEGLLKE
ncbi:hypothetical protein [Thermatribacter velox]